ncbi:MAG: PilZ domain-containing protein [Thermodesulfobacteriota bacterium]
MTKEHEKRVANRVPLDAKVLYAPEGEEWRESRSKDVSSTGMYLATQEQIETGRTLKLSFNLPNMKWQDPIQAEAEVVRVINRQGRQTGLGLRFITLKSRHFEAVQEFVDRVMGMSVGEKFESLGTRDARGGYIFSMDRLASEAQERKAAEIEKKVLAQQAAYRREQINRYLNLAGRAALVVVAFFIFYKIGGFIVKIILKLSELAK